MRMYNGVQDRFLTSCRSERRCLPAGDWAGPVPCGGNSGPVDHQCVAPRILPQLVGNSEGDFSLERRRANMEFIRDRIIETGKCKGLDLGRNYKRGTAGHQQGLPRAGAATLARTGETEASISPAVMTTCRTPLQADVAGL